MAANSPDFFPGDSEADLLSSLEDVFAEAYDVVSSELGQGVFMESEGNLLTPPRGPNDNLDLTNLDDAIREEVTHGVFNLDIGLEIGDYFEKQAQVDQLVKHSTGSDNLDEAMFRWRLGQCLDAGQRSQVIQSFREDPASLRFSYDEYVAMSKMFS